MESCAEPVGVMKKFDTGNSSHSLGVNISTERFLDKLLFFIKAVVEYAFGTHIGFAIGWLTGLCVGNAYVEHFKPVYMDDLSELSHWRLMPYDFARTGATIGVVVCVIAILLINSKLLSQRVASLYEKDVTEPEDIARAIGNSERQIQRVISKLAKKGKIVRKKADFQKRFPAPKGNTYPCLSL